MFQHYYELIDNSKNNIPAKKILTDTESDIPVSEKKDVLTDVKPRKGRNKIVIPSPKAKKVVRNTPANVDTREADIINKENVAINTHKPKNKRIKKVKQIEPKFTTDRTEVHEDIYDELKEYGYKSSIMFTDGVNSYVHAINLSGHSNIIIWKNTIISLNFDECPIQKLDSVTEPPKLLEYHNRTFTGYCINTAGIAFKENNLFRILLKDGMLPNPKYTCFISQNVEKYPFAIPIISIEQIRENPEETLRYTNENIERLLQQRLQGAINSIGEMISSISVINNYFNAFESGRKKHMAGIQTAIIQLKNINYGFIKRPPTSRRGEREAEETRELVKM
jgi:hypothetical protein